MNTFALARECNVSRSTIERYRPLVDEIIAKTKIDRNVVRNLQIKRTYQLIEMLMDDLKGARDPKSRALYYNQIYKFSSHLALITGLNVETQVHIDPQKLVIIRSNTTHKSKNSDITEVDTSTSDGVTDVTN